MGKVKFVEVSEGYIDYLAYALGSPKYLAGNKQGRIFVQFPYLLNGYTYCVPISSPKPTDYYTHRSGMRRIKSDSLHVLRLVYKKATVKNDMLKGTMRIGKMIPVPVSEITTHCIETDSRPHYAYLLGVQKSCILEKYESFIEITVSLYNMKKGAIPKSDKFEAVELIFSSLDFKTAEYYCAKYSECLEKGIPKDEISKTVMSETDGASKGESQSRQEQPGCSSWGAYTSSYGDDKHKHDDLADGSRKRKHSERHHAEEPKSVVRRLSESQGESSSRGYSKSYSGKGKGVGKGKRHHTQVR